MFYHLSLRYIFYLLLLTIIVAVGGYSHAYAQTITIDADDNTNESANSVVDENINEQKKLAKLPFAVALLPQTYLLPIYYTASPYQAIYKHQTPQGQVVDNAEFKYQFGLEMPLWSDLFHSGTSFYASYQQLSYWQFYASSQYFRETNYEPSLYWEINWPDNALWQLGIVHQSNGRGGELERSWNRAYVDFRYSGDNWLLSIKPWVLIFKDESSNIHNPDIDDFLGYGRVVFAYELFQQTFSVTLQNFVESGFDRGSVELSWSFPLTSIGLNKVRGFVQYFSGYGQSLIEYDHRTNSVGAGVILADWI